MPTISMFYGIIIRMYYFDNQQYHSLHIHVHYQNEAAVISISNGKVLEGSLRNTKLKLVEGWVEIHKDELVADWELALKGEPIFSIESLR